MQRRNLLLAAALAVACGGAAAQSDYPNRSIRLIVPFAPGGTTDIIARVIAEPLGKQLGQTVVVDNRGGAGGAIGAIEAARAAPDGYVISVATVSTTAANPAINSRIGYDPVSDFVPVINMAATPNVITVHPGFPVKDYKSFTELLKKSPGQYSYASMGTGSIGHLLMELWKTSTGAFVTHIPYRGSGPALVDVVAGHVPIMIDNLPSSLPYIKSGKLVAMVVAAPHRLADIPDVPTFEEVGLAPVNRMAYYGILAPKGTPKEIVDKLHAATMKVLEDPAVRKRIEETGSLIIGNTPEQFAQQIKDEFAIYKEVVAKQHLKLE
ncbi:MAG: tripartite tricarboxylate transporter substrate binding protein BugE [Burkholderiaceae bacterium]|jgi:tripartite-type tricarboxylate transporter receptor subunit TctC|nr:tripartite tricarboxylate transporter substrate binding protein BugE [Burkholderiaceae bacterium]